MLAEGAPDVVAACSDGEDGDAYLDALLSYYRGSRYLGRGGDRPTRTG